jgi:hypothetical protein
VRKKVGDKVKGAAIFFQQESTNTKEDNETAITTNNDNSNSNNPSTNIANNTNTVIPKEKVKYVDTKTQRSYWLDAELLKIFEKEYPKKKYDRSQIIEDLLRKFLMDNGKI